MTHEGRMLRGKEKNSRGIKDIETEYYLLNSVQKAPTIEIKPKETKKNAKSNK